MLKQDYTTRDLGSMVLTLRDDLIFTPRRVGGELTYVIEDPINSNYFTIGFAEYAFVSCLDGNTTVTQAVGLTAKTAAQETLSEHDAAAVCRWLIENELAHTAESKGAGRLAERKQHSQSNASWNPLYVRLPLFYPDGLIQRILPWTRWLFAPAAVLCFAGLFALAVYLIGDQWDRFLAASSGVLSPGRWLWLALCWVVLKIVHELAHGIVCKKYGGTVHEAGVIFILLAPLAYVDVTSSWRFRSKWPRIFTAAAGMYVELVIAAVAGLVWYRTMPGTLNDLCFNLVLMASVNTVLFNVNPLMRFDGYYILADLVDIPNLYSDGQLLLRNLARRYAFALSTKVSSGSRSRDRFIFTYGIAAFIWRQVVTVGLILLAATLLEGAGIIVAAAAIASWLAFPFLRLLKFLVKGNAWEQPDRVRFALVCLPAMAVLVVAAHWIPWPGRPRAPAIVEYAPASIVRAGSPGFVRAMHVTSGQPVRAGQLLAELENPELSAEIRDLELAMEQAQLRSRSFKQRDQLAAYQAELKQLDSLRKKYQEKQREASHLQVVAPTAGRALIRNSHALVGTYLSLGAVILSIGDESQKEVRVSLVQEKVNAFNARLDSVVLVRLSGGQRLKCRLEKIPPRASTEVPHPSLGAVNGGPLEVRKRLATGTNEETYELVRPHFHAIVPLSPSESLSLRAGQRGVVSLSRRDESIADHLAHSIHNLIPRQFRDQAPEFDVR